MNWFFIGGTEGFFSREGVPMDPDRFALLEPQALRLVAVYEQALDVPRTRVVIATAPTMGTEVRPDLGDCVFAPRFTVNTTGLTGILFGCERSATVLPADAHYLVPVRG